MILFNFILFLFWTIITLMATFIVYYYYLKNRFRFRFISLGLWALYQSWRTSNQKLKPLLYNIYKTSLRVAFKRKL